jgi:hypothetical protein
MVAREVLEEARVALTMPLLSAPQIGSSSTCQDREPHLVGRSSKGLSVRPYTGTVTTRGTVPRLIKRDQFEPVLRLSVGAAQKAVTATVIKGEG